MVLVCFFASMGGREWFCDEAAVFVGIVTSAGADGIVRRLSSV
jgi:hypothetical protein